MMQPPPMAPYARTSGRYLEGVFGGLAGNSHSALIKIRLAVWDTDRPRRAAMVQSLSTIEMGT